MLKKIALLLVLPSLLIASEQKKSAEHRAPFTFIKKTASPCVQRLEQLKHENNTNLRKLVEQQEIIEQLKKQLEAQKRESQTSEATRSELQKKYDDLSRIWEASKHLDSGSSDSD